jgi:hypothetical protein
MMRTRMRSQVREIPLELRRRAAYIGMAISWSLAAAFLALAIRAL